jgi:hypothetical protein
VFTLDEARFTPEPCTIVFDRGLDLLIEAMLSVPQDRRQWDLIDAAGLVIRGFPVPPPYAMARALSLFCR